VWQQGHIPYAYCIEFMITREIITGEELMFGHAELERVLAGRFSEKAIRHDLMVLEQKQAYSTRSRT